MLRASLLQSHALIHRMVSSHTLGYAAKPEAGQLISLPHIPANLMSLEGVAKLTFTVRIFPIPYVSSKGWPGLVPHRAH